MSELVARLRRIQGERETQTALGSQIARLRARTDRARARGLARLVRQTHAERVDQGIFRISSSAPCNADALCDALTLFGFDASHPCALDLETTGLSTGAGTIAFLIGLGVVHNDTLHIEQYLLTDIAAEPELLERVGVQLGNATPLLSYNGKSFDWPMLQARVGLRLRSHWSTRPHCDLLHLTRRAFAGVWPSCRLQDAEQRLLGLTRTGDLPSHEVPEAYRAFLYRGEETLLLAAIEHHRRDLQSLFELSVTLRAVYSAPERYQACARRIRARFPESACSYALTACG